MAEEKEAIVDPSAAAKNSIADTKPYLLIGLVVVNMLVVAFVGFMIWKGRKIEEAKPGIEKVIEGENVTQVIEGTKSMDEVGKVIPLETFIVNLAGSKGRKVLKVNMELEIKGQEVIHQALIAGVVTGLPIGIFGHAKQRHIHVITHLVLNLDIVRVFALIVVRVR